MAHLDMSLSHVQEQSVFDPLPPGDYHVRIVDTALKESSNGNVYLNVEFEVSGPDYAGRRLWDLFVLSNEVALQRLKTLAKVSGHPNPDFIRDSDEFHGLQCRVRVRTEEQEGYDPKNKISSYKPVSGMGESGPSSPGVGTQVAQKKQSPQQRAAAHDPASQTTGQNPQTSASPKPKYPWQK